MNWNKNKYLYRRKKYSISSSLFYTFNTTLYNTIYFVSSINTKACNVYRKLAFQHSAKQIYVHILLNIYFVFFRQMKNSWSFQAWNSNYQKKLNKRNKYRTKVSEIIFYSPVDFLSHVFFWKFTTSIWCFLNSFFWVVFIVIFL